MNVKKTAISIGFGLNVGISGVDGKRSFWYYWRNWDMKSPY